METRNGFAIRPIHWQSGGTSGPLRNVGLFLFLFSIFLLFVLAWNEAQPQIFVYRLVGFKGHKSKITKCSSFINVVTFPIPLIAIAGATHLPGSVLTAAGCPQTHARTRVWAGCYPVLHPLFPQCLPYFQGATLISLRVLTWRMAVRNATLSAPCDWLTDWLMRAKKETKAFEAPLARRGSLF